MFDEGMAVLGSLILRLAIRSFVLGILGFGMILCFGILCFGILCFEILGFGLLGYGILGCMILL